MNDPDVRRQLHRLAESYGDAEQLRLEVRERLEALDRAPGFTLADTDSAPHRTRGWLVAAATVAVVASGVVVVYALSSGGETDRRLVDTADGSIAAASTPVEPDVETIQIPPGERERFVSADTTPVVEFDLPVEPTLSVEPTTESDQLIEFALDAPDLAGGHLALVLPPAADVRSPDDVMEWLQSSLSQAELVAVDDVEIGEQRATRVRLVSTDDMTLTGFRLGPQTFLSASGIDRSYEAYIVNRPDQGVAIVWVDAAADEIVTARRVAEVVVASLDWQP